MDLWISTVRCYGLSIISTNIFSILTHLRADVKRLIEYWKSGFDWKKHEARLNAELPQFKTEVEVEEFGTVDMHFVHQESAVKGAIPLLFVHGCEYSVLSIFSPCESICASQCMLWTSMALVTPFLSLCFPCRSSSNPKYTNTSQGREVSSRRRN